MLYILDGLREIKNALGLGPEPGIAVKLIINIILGGFMALFVRALYRRFSSTVSNRDSFSSLFPLLTITVISVIFVVKSSLALSLGLVGALSIVRFRAAIKEPEELIYLFFCIALGLALGADFRIVAFMGLLGFTFFVKIRCARISLVDLVPCKVGTLQIARSAGSGAGGARSNLCSRSPAERTREP